MKKAFIVLFLILAAIFSYKTFFSSHDEAALNPLEALTIVADLDALTSLDPAENFEFSGMEMIANTYQRLLIKPSLEKEAFEEAIASQGSFSSDGKYLTFTLKRHLKFASGNPVRPQDVAFSFIRLAKIGKAPAQILENLGWTPQNIHTKIKLEGEDRLTLEVDPRLPRDRTLSIFTALSLSIVDEKEALAHSPQD